MNVLVACEFSGVVRDAFRARGHNAWSCDLEPCEGDPRWHLRQDVFGVLEPWKHGLIAHHVGCRKWDLMIAHPPCTYLCSMGIWWNHKRPERWALTDEAERFFMALYNADIPRIAVENPVGTMSTRFRKPDQIVNPWHFGQEFNKPTCLWLKGLPKLIPTNIVGKGKFYIKANGNRISAWSHITSGTRKAERAKIASRTFTGFAEAMASQWGAV